MEPTQFLLGLFGAVCIVVGILIGRRHWTGAVGLGLGIGASGYALLSLLTDDPQELLLDLLRSIL